MLQNAKLTACPSAVASWFARRVCPGEGIPRALSNWQSSQIIHGKSCAKTKPHRWHIRTRSFDTCAKGWKVGAAGVLIRFAAGSSFNDMPQCVLLMPQGLSCVSILKKRYKISVSGTHTQCAYRSCISETFQSLETTPSAGVAKLEKSKISLLKSELANQGHMRQLKEKKFLGYTIPESRLDPPQN
jgi:hypothetical protein